MITILLLIPVLGITYVINTSSGILKIIAELRSKQWNSVKSAALITGAISFSYTLVLFLLYDASSIHFQFVANTQGVISYYLHFGLDGISVFFVLLTVLIGPVCLLSNWVSILNPKHYVIFILMLEMLLLIVFISVDVLMFYIFFESILPPLFLLIGIFGSSDKIRASFYIFVYTLLGSLFLLIGLLFIQDMLGNTDLNVILKGNMDIINQIFIFIGIFIAFAVKTPTIFLNSWLLKAHVESPLGGSILLAGV